MTSLAERSKSQKGGSGIVVSKGKMLVEILVYGCYSVILLFSSTDHIMLPSPFCGIFN